MSKTMIYDSRQLLRDFFTTPPGEFLDRYRRRRVMWAELRADGLFDVSLSASGKNTTLGIHPRENLEALAEQHNAGKLFIEGETTEA